MRHQYATILASSLHGEINIGDLRTIPCPKTLWIIYIIDDDSHAEHLKGITDREGIGI
ncbi:hypothetical protein RND71_026273 [Anisodus tanguticus]|uniref:Uncharacterized protein n=1 Tax=Anisodus tanguticus TaxID=243964 RepID=A0AAE1RN04_9SOLA|nr:hypothetical protein RND71_026273 [Anisodus tanguticus]